MKKEVTAVSIEARSARAALATRSSGSIRDKELFHGLMNVARSLLDRFVEFDAGRNYTASSVVVVGAGQSWLCRVYSNACFEDVVAQSGSAATNYTTISLVATGSALQSQE